MKHTAPFIQYFNFLYLDVAPSAVELITLEFQYSNSLARKIGYIFGFSRMHYYVTSYGKV